MLLPAFAFPAVPSLLTADWLLVGRNVLVLAVTGAVDVAEAGTPGEVRADRVAGTGRVLGLGMVERGGTEAALGLVAALVREAADEFDAGGRELLDATVAGRAVGAVEVDIEMIWEANTSDALASRFSDVAPFAPAAVPSGPFPFFESSSSTLTGFFLGFLVEAGNPICSTGSLKETGTYSHRSVTFRLLPLPSVAPAAASASGLVSGG